VSEARGLGVLVRLALRNVRRQARRSLLTAAAMVLGLALLMLSRAIADGLHEAWITAGVRLGTGHVAIQAPGFLESGSLSDRLDSARLSAAQSALAAPAVAPLVRAAAPRLEASGLASSATAAAPVLALGVDPAAEAHFSELPQKLVAGRYLQPDDRLGAYIGERLARRLSLRLGSRFVLTAQTAAGDIEGQLFRVVGLFRTGIPEMDEGLVQLPLGTVRRWLGTPGAATTLAVLLYHSRATPDVTGQLRRLAGDSASGIRVLSWRQAAPELDSAVRIDDFGDYIFHAFLLAIVTLAILNAVLMSVLHRRREFAVLRALGLTARQTGGVVFTEGLALTVVSGGVGLMLGWGVTWLFWRHGMNLSFLLSQDLSVSGVIVNPVIIPEFRVSQVAWSLFFVALMGVLASIYPATQASRIDVAEAMKFDR
jgi:ABC-type lipoprotein release transport system permease subunit